ncbi:TrmH family RNA methyltransferase [Candidatus Similichlamydia laticola]|uniref:Putative rRNA methylase n=1 Tax=Candidatus Similichlamydia laticola TaxID=2170265 RepID=A0A369KCY6_9BACT|nr:TrmH family RNA methyltransferase [Candidatus Similichlamydia laticola]RDB31320.1 putative rRNA methylase [Candidatus Similichlamydia laticola]
MTDSETFLSDRPWLTSAHNPKLKSAVRLKNRRYRKKTESFLVEGFRELSRYLEGLKKGHLGFLPPVTLLFCKELFLGGNEIDLLQAFAALGTEVFHVPAHLFSSLLSHRDRPDGLLAIAPIPKRDLFSWNPDYISRIAVLDQIEKPGNLGAILRSADAAGIQAIFLSDPVTDAWNPNAVRASIGTLFTLPLFQGLSSNLRIWLKSRGVQLIATKPGNGRKVGEINWSKPTGLLLGSEQFGLSSFWLQHADQIVSLPTLGSADSLNVSTAAAIFFFAPLIG